MPFLGMYIDRNADPESIISILGNFQRMTTYLYLYISAFSRIPLWLKKKKKTLKYVHLQLWVLICAFQIKCAKEYSCSADMPVAPTQPSECEAHVFFHGPKDPGTCSTLLVSSPNCYSIPGTLLYKFMSIRKCHAPILPLCQ